MGRLTHRFWTDGFMGSWARGEHHGLGMTCLREHVEYSRLARYEPGHRREILRERQRIAAGIYEMACAGGFDPFGKLADAPPRWIDDDDVRRALLRTRGCVGIAREKTDRANRRAIRRRTVRG